MIQNEIVCALFGTKQFIIKPVDVRINCSFFTKSGKFDHLKIDCISEKYMKNI